MEFFARLTVSQKLGKFFIFEELFSHSRVISDLICQFQGTENEPSKWKIGSRTGRNNRSKQERIFRTNEPIGHENVRNGNSIPCF